MNQSLYQYETSFFIPSNTPFKKINFSYINFITSFYFYPHFVPTFKIPPHPPVLLRDNWHTELLQEGGPLPGPETGLLFNTQK